MFYMDVFMYGKQAFLRVASNVSVFFKRIKMICLKLRFIKLLFYSYQGIIKSYMLMNFTKKYNIIKF